MTTKASLRPASPTYVQKLKQQGDIRHIGFSSHAPKMAMRVIETGLPEMMLFSINPAFDLYPADVHVLNDSPDAAAFKGRTPPAPPSTRLCAQKGIGITVMKTLGAGKLISPSTPPSANR